MGALRDWFAACAAEVAETAHTVLGRDYVGTVVYGSVGRGTPRPTSDLDLLVVAEGLPHGRGPRRDLAEAIEAAMQHRPERSLPDISLILRTPEEVRSGFPLMLEIAVDGKLVDDRQHLVAQLLVDWQMRIHASGARRIHHGETWHWDLQGDKRPGEWRI